MADTYYTQTQAAAVLGLSKQRVGALVLAGDLAAVEPLPGVKRITARELARFRRLKRGPGPRKNSRKSVPAAE